MRTRPRNRGHWLSGGLVCGVLVFSGCGTSSVPDSPSAPAAALAPSPRPIVGRVLAVDAGAGFAFVDLAASPPAAALQDGAELLTRTADLKETARLRASRYLRGRTLGTKIVAGQPAAGDEVVWLAP